MHHPDYIRFEFNTRKWPESVLRLYPLVCLHLGAKECDWKFITAQIKRIKEDPCARWVYLGDGGECVTKLSKGDIWQQVLNPGQQMAALMDILGPVADKGLFGIQGNHGNRIYNETGLKFDKQLMTQLRVPYMGVQTGANLVVNRSSYDCFFHHGIDSGVRIRAKIAAAEQFPYFVNADAIFTAHSHVAQELTPAPLYEFDNNTRQIRTKLRHQYICGTAYDSRTGYAAQKGYPPLLPAWLIVTFDGRIREGTPVVSQSSQAVRSSGAYELDQSYIQAFQEED